MRRLLVGLLPVLAGSLLGCDENSGPDDDRVRLTGTVADAQSNTRLFFYDDELRQLGRAGVQVRQDGSYGPVALAPGDYFVAGTAAGFTTGQFQAFEIAETDSVDTLDVDLDPVTVPLAVGNRWTYEEVVFSPRDTATVIVEIVAQQPGTGVAAVFTVEERRTDPSTGGGVTTTYFLAQDASGIRKSTDATIDATDELLLRLPATLGTTWSTVDFATGAPLQKRIRAISCDEERCTETNDFTIAQEPAGVFMSVTVLHSQAGRLVGTVFSDIGIVDSFVQATSSGEVISQRKLRAFFAPSAVARP